MFYIGWCVCKVISICLQLLREKLRAVQDRETVHDHVELGGKRKIRKTVDVLHLHLPRFSRDPKYLYASINMQNAKSHADHSDMPMVLARDRTSSPRELGVGIVLPSLLVIPANARIEHGIVPAQLPVPLLEGMLQHDTFSHFV